MPHDVENPDVAGALARELAALAAEHDATLATVSKVVESLQSGAIFDWYQRDALIRRMLAHVEKKR
jgi:hypothetical protein